MRNVLPALSLLLVPSLHAQVVINEVDYDQPGTDNAEYVEIKNIGSTPFDLSGLAVIMYNGNTGTGVEYRNISNPIWPSLMPGNYFVICANQSLTLNCGHQASPMTNLIQNGPTDAIALVDINSMAVLDILSYGGTLVGFSEGAGSTEVDSNVEGLLSLNRWPDGNDTNDNEADFTVGCPTPGVTNDINLANCGIMTGIRMNTATAGLTILPTPNGEGVIAYMDGVAGGQVHFEVFDANGALIASRSTASSSWSFGTEDLRGRLLLIRATTEGTSLTRRIMIP